jgi:hypothetical protein
MRDEAEIQRKLRDYEAMLAGMEAGIAIDIPDIFLQVSQYFPREAMEALKTLRDIDEFIGKAPPEDRYWIARAMRDSLMQYARDVLTNRIVILKWVLEMELDEG